MPKIDKESEKKIDSLSRPTPALLSVQSLIQSLIPDLVLVEQSRPRPRRGARGMDICI